MSEDLKKKLQNHKEGTLSDDDLDKVAGGDGKGSETPVTFNYSIGQSYSQNLNASTKTVDTFQIVDRYPSGGVARYKVHIEIWENGVKKRSGDGWCVSESEIKDIADGGSIRDFADRYSIPTCA